MTRDPLQELADSSLATMAAALAGKQLLARGYFVDAEPTLISLAVVNLDAIDPPPAGILDDGSYTVHLEVWAKPEGGPVTILVTDSADDPNELQDICEELAYEATDLLAQHNPSHEVTHIWHVEYAGHPHLIWRHPE